MKQNEIMNAKVFSDLESSLQIVVVETGLEKTQNELSIVDRHILQ